jgi:hypothetical protein
MVYWFLDNENRYIDKFVFEENTSNEFLQEIANRFNASKWMKEEDYFNSLPPKPDDGKVYQWSTLLYCWVEDID